MKLTFQNFLTVFLLLFVSAGIYGQELPEIGSLAIQAGRHLYGCLHTLQAIPVMTRGDL